MTDDTLKVSAYDFLNAVRRVYGSKDLVYLKNLKDALCIIIYERITHANTFEMLNIKKLNCDIIYYNLGGVIHELSNKN